MVVSDGASFELAVGKTINMKNNSTYSDFLKQENELTKLKIQAEFGFEVNGHSELNPAIENIWLKQILEFERAMVNKETIKIKERIGNPFLKPSAEIPDQEIPAELQKVMELLHSKNLVIDSVAGIDDREMYRFITEELLEEETDNNVPSNMLVCYLYEEFHPNPEYDIKNRGKELMNLLESETEVNFDFVIISESDDETQVVRKDYLIRRLKLFKDAFDEVKVKKYNVKSVTITNDCAEVLFEYKLSLLPAESRSRHMISGIGKLYLKNTYDWWGITDIEMKGVV
jgi:hypothetical protein